MMMESTPSMTNWQHRSKLKRPKMHLLSSIQAVAHGADSVQYFQWRKSRGRVKSFMEQLLIIVVMNIRGSLMMSKKWGRY